MQLHYDLTYIQDNGEIRVHQEITQELMYSEENWHLIHSLRISGKYHPGQKSGECDFILVSKQGILVLEVKGGLVELLDNALYQVKATTKERRKITPFNQVEQNAAGLIKFFRENGIRNCFVARVVVFPECEFNYKGISYEKLWHLGQEGSMFDYMASEIQKQKEDHIEKELQMVYSLLERDPENGSLRKRVEQIRTNYPNLNTHEIDVLVKILLPHVKGEGARSRFIISKENAKSYSEINQAFLMGLHRNRKLMVQGPPGCGKSSYALELMQQIMDENGVKGLFLCWNEFLAVSIKNRFSNEENESLDVFPYYDFVQELIEQAGLPPDTLSYKNISEIAICLDLAFESLSSMNKLPEYDFIVVDEAQDLFDRGLEQILDLCQKTQSGIESGRYYVFYDNTQAFKRSIQYSQYNFVQEYLFDQSTSFVMPIRFRTFGDTGIADFVDDIQQGKFDTEMAYGNSVEFINASMNRIPEVLKRTRDRMMRETGCKHSDIVALFSSNLVSGAADRIGPLDEEISEMQGFTKLSNENLFSLPESNTGYTTMLKYKGLEADIVILIVSDVFNKKLDMLYQLFIGASRAISRLVVIVNKE